MKNTLKNTLKSVLKKIFAIIMLALGTFLVVYMMILSWDCEQNNFDERDQILQEQRLR